MDGMRSPTFASRSTFGWIARARLASCARPRHCSSRAPIQIESRIGARLRCTTRFCAITPSRPSRCSWSTEPTRRLRELERISIGPRQPNRPSLSRHAEDAATCWACLSAVRHLLDLGVGVRALFEEGDGYFDVANGSTALHVAAWRARHATVRLLIGRGAPLEALDGKGRTPLALAVRACVDSYWQAGRSPESVQALLQAGASVKGVQFPSGYAEVDELLQSHGATA
jgi:Ankyrin repeats (3 copies)